MKDVLAIFDIGKTNKKLILFDSNLTPVFQEERTFGEIQDDDGFPCDDIEKIKIWVFEIIRSIVKEGKFNIKAVNFSTYGASLVFLDKDGKELTPVYNYLKSMPEEVTESVYNKFGGVVEFSRQTASPALGFLNSGFQALWLKKVKPEIFEKVAYILHFPQYWSFVFSGIITSEYTSIGCHTALWNFDTMSYHSWLESEGITFPSPEKNDITFAAKDFPFKVGIGIHDSSASLAPYILKSPEKFLLISTGTWCINMNPFNNEPLTKKQLENDCLSYLSISQQPVKSSRFFMGHIHDVNLERISAHFGVPAAKYKEISLNLKLLTAEPLFFKNGFSGDFIDREANLSGFRSFEEAYHQLIFDLTEQNSKSISYILPLINDIGIIYISGGFSKNEIFVHCMQKKYPDKKVVTSDFDNSSALGAALVVYKEFGGGLT